MGGPGSTAGGLAAIVALQRGAEVPSSPVADGSGLSSTNRATARQLVAWLRYLDHGAHGAEFRSFLPVACVDGTLRGRMCKTPASGRVQAKTGTLDFVRTLAGYSQTASGRKVTFTFLTSGGTGAVAAIDQSLAAIASFTG